MSKKSGNKSPIDLIGEKARRAQELAEFVFDWRQVEFTRRSESQEEALEIVFTNNGLPDKPGLYCLTGHFKPKHLSLPVGEFGLLKQRLPSTINYSAEFSHFLYIGLAGDLRDRWRGHHWLKALRRLVKAGVQIDFSYQRWAPHREGKAATINELSLYEKELICYLQPVFNNFEFWQRRQKLDERRRDEKPPDPQPPEPYKLGLLETLVHMELESVCRPYTELTDPQPCPTEIFQVW